MNKIRILLISSIFLGSTFAFAAETETSDELFKKVFGKDKTEKNLLIDVSFGEHYIGSLDTRLEGDNVVSVSGLDLKKIIHPLIREEFISFYQFPSGHMLIDQLKKNFPLTILYNPSELRFAVTLPAEHMKPKESRVYDDLLPYFSRRAVEPAPLSLVLNYKIEQQQVKNIDTADSLTGQTDFYSNIKNIGIESHQSYSSIRSQKWQRQSSKILIDHPERLQRLEIGDVNYPILPYQQYSSLGGVAIYSDFSLNPYRKFTPTSSFEYLVDNRSLVKTYVNNILLKTEYMAAGRYSVRDIPLNNGINRITVEIIDELGNTKILVFNEASSLDLISEGSFRYSLATGAIAEDTDAGKKYTQSDYFSTGFFQYGLKRYWTSALYAEGSNKYQMLGANQIFATTLGNFSYDALGTKNNFHNGFLSQLTYQLNTFGSYWYDTHTLTVKQEYRSPWYNARGENSQNKFDWSSYLTYNFPLWEKITLSAGGNYHHSSQDLPAKYGYNGSLSYRFHPSGSLTANLARTRDELKNWSEQLYFFLNFSFGESASYVSAYYDHESQTKRLTAIRDTGRKINDLKAVATAENNLTSRQGSLDLQYNTVLADVGVRQEIIGVKAGRTGSKSSVRLMSALAYVHNGEESAFSLSRPISSSFVLFKPNKGWEKQKFGIQTSSEENDSETGLFGEALVSGLSPYQYRRLQLNPRYLEPGYILGQESYIVHPTRNSGHLFMVGQSGLMVLKGRLVDSSQKPIALKVGIWRGSNGKNIPFFTGRDGEFLIEGINHNEGALVLSDEKHDPAFLKLEPKQNGIVEVGDVILPKNENVI